MDDAKRILIFSDAGGTGRSYHADLGAKNQRLRVHYLLEPGWKADNAIQGLGRTNRTNQAQPPLFRPVATDVKGEKRFLSTIA
ncbi:strawberry notch C-terminal domain-containing protein, partial [Marinobacter salarius]